MQDVSTKIHLAHRAASVASGFLVFALFSLEQAHAFNAITLDSGYGLEDTKLLRLNYSTGKNLSTPVNGGWIWFPYWEANISYWYLHRNKDGVDDLFEIGITPNLRLERDHVMAWGRPYMEVGIGTHLLSKVHIGTRNLSSSFQFGSHVGLGIRFGANEQWELALRGEHLSNADLKQPNPGINFTIVRLGYHW